VIVTLTVWAVAVAAADNARDWTRDLSERAFDAQRRMLRTYSEIIERSSDMRVDERLVPPAFAQFARDVADLSVQYLDGLLELGRQYQDDMLRTANRGRGGRATRGDAWVTSADDDGSALGVVEVDLHAALGEVAHGSLVLDNRHAQSAEVRFLISDFGDADGGELFRSDLRVEPATVPLEPGEERVVQLALTIDPTRFEPGHVYEATIIVRGIEDLELAITAYADIGE
jgi:hypothetical protein